MLSGVELAFRRRQLGGATAVRAAVRAVRIKELDNSDAVREPAASFDSVGLQRHRPIRERVMDENDIKAAALTRIRRLAKGRPLPVVTSEFSLNGTGIRADLAVLDGDCFCGIEIKSETDTLKRLPNQMKGYAQYFDRTQLIVAPKHLRGLRAIELHGAEVWRQEVLTDWQLHAAGEQRRVSGQWLLHLLTAEEERRAAGAVERRRSETPSLDIDEARRLEFAATFRRRYEATSCSFWNSVAGRRITSDDLRSLSRFHAERQQKLVIEHERTQRLAGWLSAMQSAHQTG